MRRSFLGALPALVVRPQLWPVALGQLRALAVPGWWRRLPFLPLPAKEWLGFRMETAYGDKAARPSGADLVSFLEWCRQTSIEERRVR